MSRFNQFLPLLAAAAVFCTCLSGQRTSLQTKPSPGKIFPPDIIQDESVDPVKIAPNRYSVDLENPELRVLRAKIPAIVRVAIHGHRAGLLVALTEVHLRLVRPDGSSHELHVAPGATRWLDAETHSEENLNLSPCEFLFVEHKTAN